MENAFNEQKQRDEKNKSTATQMARVFTHVETERNSYLNYEKPREIRELGGDEISEPIQTGAPFISSDSPRVFTHVNEEKEKIPVHSDFGSQKLPRVFTHIDEEREKMPVQSDFASTGLPRVFTHINEARKKIPVYSDSALQEKPQSTTSEQLSALGIQYDLKEQCMTNAVEKKTDSSQPVAIENVCNNQQDWKNFELRLLQTICKLYDTQDGEQLVYFYRFQIQIAYESFETVVKADEIDSIKWVKRATHGKAYIKKGKNANSFDEYVSTIITESNVQVQTQYITNGWKQIKSGDWVYVMGDSCIGIHNFNICGDAKSVFEYDRGNIGRVEVFREAMGMLDICEDKTLTIPLFLFTHAGVLTRLFEVAGHPIKFLMAVIGETNSRKTSLSLCMTKLFNRREIQLPDITFNSTEGGIEKKAGLNPDTVLVIDDYMPAQTKAKQRLLDSKLEKIVRMYGERKSVERMTDFAKNPHVGYYPIRNIAVVTGEQISGVQSSLTRSLILKIKRNSVKNNKLSYYQEHFKILNTHIYDFLEFTATEQKKILQFIALKVEEYRSKSKLDPPRYSEMYAILMTVTEILISYAVERKFIGTEESCAIYDAWNNAVLRVIRHNIAELQEKNLAANVTQVFQAIIENERTYPLPTEEVKNYGDVIFEDDRYLYIRMDTLLKRIRSYFALWGYEVPQITKSLILNELENAQIIETKGKSEGKRTLKLPGSKENGQRFLYIKKEMISEPLNGAANFNTQ